MTKRHLLITFLMIMLNFANFSAEARDKVVRESQYFILDGKKYSKGQIIYDFVNVAFPKTLVNDNNLKKPWLLSNQDNKKLESDKKFYKTEMPWAYEYVYRQKGYPRIDVLKRWNKKIKIGLGWPPINVQSMIAEKEDEKKYDVITSVVDSLQDDIFQITGIEVELIQPKNESVNSYANLRIVPTNTFFQFNKFKSYPVETHGKWSFRRFENDAIGKTKFTEWEKSQVEGYFLAEKDNSIGMAFCLINPQLSGDLFKKLVSECIIRSLGLPESSILNSEATIGRWNKVFDAYSKMPTSEIISNYTKSHIVDIIEGKKGNLSDNNKIPTDLLDRQINSNWTEYDKFILSLLYCKKLSSDIGLLEIIAKLQQSDECFLTSSAKE